MTTYLLKFELGEAAEHDLRRLQELNAIVGQGTDTPDQFAEWSNLFEELRESLTINIVEEAKPLHETSIVTWLPVNGLISPVDYKQYLFTDGTQTTVGYMIDGEQWWQEFEGDPAFNPTRYAELPILK